MYGSKMVVEFARPDKKQEPIVLELKAPVCEKSVVDDATRWMNDNRVILFLRRSTGCTTSFEADWISKCNSDDSCHWRIYADGVHIGGCGLHGISYEHRYAEIGLMIGEPSYWGRGIAQVAEIAITEYAFSNVVAEGLNKVVACVYVAEDGSGNTASQAAIRKVGFRDVGVLRRHKWLQGRWYDEWICELLQEEWQPIRLEKMKQSGIKRLDLYPGCEDKGFQPILIE